MLSFQQLWRKLLLSLVFGAIVFIALSFYANFRELIQALRMFSPLYIPLILGLAFCNYLVRFVKWHFYVNVLRIPLSRLQSFTIFLAGLIMSISPGKFGEVLKSFLIKEIHDTPISKSAPIVVVERLTDLIGLVVLVMLGLGSTLISPYFFIISIPLLAGIVLILSWPAFCQLLIHGMEKLIVKCVGSESAIAIDAKAVSKTSIDSHHKRGKISGLLLSVPEKLRVAYGSISHLITPMRLLWATVLSVVSWSCEGLAFYVLLTIFHQHKSFTEAIFIYSFSIIIGAVTMLPGGVGLTETSLSGLLILDKVPKNIAVAITLLIRIATLWFAVAVGSFVLFLFLKRYGSSETSPSGASAIS